MAIIWGEPVVNFFQKAWRQHSVIQHWPKGGIRLLLLGLLAVSATTSARAATVINVPCGEPIHVSGNDLIVRLQPCTYPSLYFAGFPGILEGNGATIDLSNSTYAATVFGNNMTVRDLRVINSREHGGMFIPGLNVTLERVVVSGNRSTQDPGGGILASDSVQTLTLLDCTISDNVGRYGAGLWIHPNFNGGTIRIVRSTISSNHAVYTPGDDASGLGGGLWVDYSVQHPSTLEITNSTISGNIADRIGGAMFLNGLLTVPINDSTITGNRAGLEADAIRDETGGVPNPGVALRRSIVAGNGLDSVRDCGVGFNDFRRDYGYNVLEGTCVGAFAPESTTKVVVSNEVLLGRLADNGGLTKTHLPLADSPALNRIPAGSVGCTPGTTDQRGAARPQATGCDSGSVEAGGIPNTPPLIAGTPLLRTAGSPAANAPIATVNDAEDGISLALTVNGAASAMVNGVTVSGLSVNAMGQVIATVEASCTATNAIFTLGVTDSGGKYAETTFDVTINAATPPSLGTYPPTAITGNGSTTVTPTVAPAGTFTNLTVSAPGFTGSFTINPTTGVVTIGNALPAGTYTVTVQATGCTGTATKSFTLTVVENSCGSSINPATLPAFTVGTPFVQTLSGSPTGSYAFSLLYGPLPPGVNLVNTLGIYSLRGTPTTRGTYTFTLRSVKNGTTCVAVRSYTVTVR